MWNEDLGHIADRGYRQRYESSVFVWKHGAESGEVETAARIPEGAGLACEVRSARTAAALERAAWRPVEDGRFTLTATTAFSNTG